MLSNTRSMPRGTLTVRYAAIILTLPGFIASTAHAQRGRDTASATPKTLKTAAGFPLAITYFNSVKGREAPAVILLHDKGRNQVGWEKVAQKLQTAGYAVVTADIRMHGKSKPKTTQTTRSDKRKPEMNLRPTDYQKMVSDLDTIKDFLMERHHEQKLNIRKTAVVAIGMSAPIAIQYAAFDWGKQPYDDGPTRESRTPKGQDIRALALLSPEVTVPGLKTQQAIRAIGDPRKEIAVFIQAGMADKTVRKNAEKLHQQLKANPKNDKVVFRKGKNRINGHDFLNERNWQVTADILNKFLDNNLSSLEDTWRIRKSKIEL